jgi:tetratricopeptide (TPR) repeat protein
VTSWRLTFGFAVTFLALAAAEAPVVYVEQPTGIALDAYVKSWPGLAPRVARIGHGERGAVKAELKQLAASGGITDGELNLLAQLAREDGELDDAQAFAERAVALNPKQPLDHFQRAMIAYTRLSKATNKLEQWKWHRQAKAAYEAAFALDPKPIPYRYYLVYSYLQTPAYAGGDKDRALRLAQEGLSMGQKEFYVIRADVHRVRGEDAAAWADYDRAIAENTFKLRSFLAAGDRALELKDTARAKRYFEWAVKCRPDSKDAHAGLARASP